MQKIVTEGPKADQVVRALHKIVRERRNGIGIVESHLHYVLLAD